MNPIMKIRLPYSVRNCWLAEELVAFKNYCSMESVSYLVNWLVILVN